MFKSVTPNVNFPELERKILDFWYKEKIVGQYLHRNDKSKKRFSFLDGPITANNPMGIHHGWSRTFKDLWQRFYNMRGYRERFQNGFDCQGLWVEVEVEKELGLTSKKDIENLVPGDRDKSIAKFVQLCKERVLKYSKIQTEQSKRLGYFMDWDNSYFTMSDENNYMIWHFLKVCHENGWIYKGTDVAPWCPRCETAISQHEMLTEDYKEVTHKSVYLRLPIAGKQSEYLLIWTTTPWTIPANTAVAVDGDLEYALVEDDKNEKYWVAKQLIGKIFSKKAEIIKVADGKDLIGIRYTSPYDHLPYIKTIDLNSKKLFHTVIATDPLLMPISVAEGTGLVHTSTSTGTQDHQLGKKFGLPVIPAIDDRAYYLDGFGELTGKNAKENPALILDYLEQNGWVYKIENYKHRYPACWRCKSELVWKVTDEWYIAMDVRPLQVQKSKVKSQKSEKDNKTLRERMIEVAKKIKWIPEFGLERELDWLNNMHDWLISKKNRYWGLALPIWECGRCGHFIVIGSKEELKEKVIAGWQDFDGKSPHKPQIDALKIKCSKCGEVIPRIEPVGNPWLDAGIVAFSTYIDPDKKNLSYVGDKKYWQEWYPADFITESFPGQFKNWFYSLIAMSTVLENTNSFKTVLGFATLLGEDGRPMHKSWGNAIEFNEGADKIGVDVMRWMYVTQNPSENLLFGYKKADEVRRKFHLMLWNIYNFFVTYANVDDFQPSTNSKFNPAMAGQNSKISAKGRSSSGRKIQNVLDKWIMAKLDNLIKMVTDSLEKYDAFAASNEIGNFVGDLSTWYIRRSRNRIGPTANDTDDKEACYITLHEVLTILVKLLAPFTPFLTEEIYRNLTGEKSVHLGQWPVQSSKFGVQSTELLEKMEFVRKVCEAGHAKRKEYGIKVRQPLNKFKVQSASWRTKFKVDEDLIQLIKDELNVKEVEVSIGKEELRIDLDKNLTPELKAEGQARDLIRQIQLKRKEKGCGLDEKIVVTLPAFPQYFVDYIKKETLAVSIQRGEKLSVEPA